MEVELKVEEEEGEVHNLLHGGEAHELRDSQPYEFSGSNGVMSTMRLSIGDDMNVRNPVRWCDVLDQSRLTEETLLA